MKTRYIVLLAVVVAVVYGETEPVKLEAPTPVTPEPEAQPVTSEVTTLDEQTRPKRTLLLGAALLGKGALLGAGLYKAKYGGFGYGYGYPYGGYGGYYGGYGYPHYHYHRHDSYPHYHGGYGYGYPHHHGYGAGYGGYGGYAYGGYGGFGGYGGYGWDY